MKTPATNNNPFADADIIYAYTRQDAIEDGLLVDVSKFESARPGMSMAQEAGWVYPVAMTAAAWEDCVEWNETIEKRKGFTGQSIEGRLWDVLYMAALKARILKTVRTDNTNYFYFELLRVPAEGRGLKPRKVSLKVVCGPEGPSGEPCITIMLPNED